MLKNINFKKLLTSEVFIEEPVNNLCNEIHNNHSKKIILTGGRGTGKSTSLYYHEKTSVNTPNPCIYTCFDGCGITSSTNQEIFNERFLKHYYELTLSYKILNYIELNYPSIYESHLKEYKEYLYFLSDNTHYYLYNTFTSFSKPELTRYLEPTELSEPIINQFKKYAEINSLSLAIDRFDWTNSNNELTQKILSSFFDIFNKVIITSDDETLLNKNNRSYLEEKEYSFIDLNYGTNLSTIKELIIRRIIQYNEDLSEGYRHFPENIITDDIYQHLITTTNGNIEVLLDIISNFIVLWQWQDSSLDILKTFDSIIQNQTNQNKVLKKMLGHKKLYL